MLNLKLGTSFDKVSKAYNYARPDYPLKLIKDIIKISKLRSNSKILEIGTGTGLATKPFAKLNYNITALDLSKDEINIAKKNLSRFKNVNYIVSKFEDAKLSEKEFDLIFAAQTFHWIDQKKGYKLVTNYLKNNGYFAMFCNYQGKTPLEKKIRKLYVKYCYNFQNTKEYGTMRNIQKRFEESGFFCKIKRKKYLRNLVYTKRKYLKLIESYSWVSCLEKEQRYLLLKEIMKLLVNKQRLIIPVETILLIAKKK